METRPDNPPVIAIVGETASGKTALALELAQQFNGEIIAADSRTVYKGLDIGTAKPTAKEQNIIKHHLIDVVNPDTKFSAAAFKEKAIAAIADIGSRGKVAFLVGGTGLYIDAVLYNFNFRSPPEPQQRAALEALSVEELQAMIAQQALPMPANYKNPRHLIRVIETAGVQSSRNMLRSNTLVLGKMIDRQALKENLKTRVDAMVLAGFVDEVRRMYARFGWEAPALQAPGYRAFREYIEGTVSLEDAKAAFVHNDYALAKRQRTWFKRNKDIHWICKTEEAVDLVTTFLNK